MYYGIKLKMPDGTKKAFTVVIPYYESKVDRDERKTEYIKELEEKYNARAVSWGILPYPCGKKHDWPEGDDCPSFCYEFCIGRTSCPNNKSCSE